ncbi:MAG: ABC transporter substrate binding protein, partial [Candidatus Krumholzibacteria bacterium]|nr:ABC transporter substrate binding protein [Candidatus Krumholzibacteria bacterium]
MNTYRSLPAALGLFWVSVMLAVSLLGCDTEPRQYRLEVLTGNPDHAEIVNGFKEKMTELGYREGIEIVYHTEYYVTPHEARAGVEKILRESSNIDLIFTLFTEVSVIAKEATRDTNIPLVFAYAGIEGSDLVSSVREPGGRVTGVRYPGSEQIGKRLEILHEIAPRHTRVFAGYSRNYPNSLPALTIIRSLAPEYGMTLVEVPVDDVAGLERELQMRNQAADPGVDALLSKIILLLSDPLFLAAPICRFGRVAPGDRDLVYLCCPGFY